MKFGSPILLEPSGLVEACNGIALPSPRTKFLAQCSHTHNHLRHHRRRCHRHHRRFTNLRYELLRLIGYVWDWWSTTWHVFISSKCQYSLEIKSVAYHRVTDADFLIENWWKRKTANYSLHLLPVRYFTTCMSLVAFAATGLHKPSCSDSSHFRETALIGITQRSECSHFT